MACRDAHESLGDELLLELREGAAVAQHLSAGHVVVEVVTKDVHVEHVAQAHHAQTVRGGNREALARPSLHHAHRPVHAEREVRVLHRLDHEVEGVHPIAAHRVLGEVGHEDERRLGVVGPQELGRLHAVDAGHVDVHEDEVGDMARLDELEG